MCGIILDKGVVDDHMPNNVMDSLIILFNNLGTKPNCEVPIEIIDGNSDVCGCTEMNGNGTTEENEHTETRIDSINLEVKGVSLKLEEERMGK